MFTYNRPRLDEFGITGAFFDAVVKQAKDAGLCRDDHFSGDGTMIESLASLFEELSSERRGRVRCE